MNSHISSSAFSFDFPERWLYDLQTLTNPPLLSQWLHFPCNFLVLLHSLELPVQGWIIMVIAVIFVFLISFLEEIFQMFSSLIVVFIVGH